MSAQVIKKTDIPKEPKFNGNDKPISSALQNCSSSEKEAEDKTEEKITAFYFANTNGERIEEITNQEEVILVIKTVNLSGKELIIRKFENKELFILNGTQITDEDIIKVKVTGNETKIKLQLAP